SEIVDPNGKKRFPDRKLEAIEVPYTDEERGAHKKLQRYCALRQETARDDVSSLGTEFVLKLLKKRLFSSPAAFLVTLGEHEKTLRGLRKESRPERSVAGTLRRELARVEDDYADDAQYEASENEAVGTATTVFGRLGDEERKLLRELRDWAERATARADAKAKKLLAWLDEMLRPSGNWNEERVIIFTEYRATQKWLQELLARHGLAS